MLLYFGRMENRPSDAMRHPQIFQRVCDRIRQGQ